jgi:hypothetical protein
VSLRGNIIMIRCYYFPQMTLSLRRDTQHNFKKKKTMNVLFIASIYNIVSLYSFFLKGNKNRRINKNPIKIELRISSSILFHSLNIGYL